jgi:hypothetical protein
MVTHIDKEMHTEFWCGNYKGKEHLKELSLGEKITYSMDGINLPQDRVHWRAFVNTVMNSRA